MIAQYGKGTGSWSLLWIQYVAGAWYAVIQMHGGVPDLVARAPNSRWYSQGPEAIALMYDICRELDKAAEKA